MRTSQKTLAIVLVCLDLFVALLIGKEVSEREETEQGKVGPTHHRPAVGNPSDQVTELQRTFDDRAKILRAKDKAEAWAFYVQSAGADSGRPGSDRRLYRAISEYRDFLATVSLNPDVLIRLKELLALRYIEGRCSSTLPVHVRPLVGIPDTYVYDSGYVDSLIQPLLNEEDFERFNEYNLTLPARRDLSDVQTSLRIEDAPLNSEQYANCVSVFTSLPSPPTPPLGSPSKLFEDYVNNRIKTNELRLEKLSQVLASKQLEIFKENMQSDIVQLRMRIKQTTFEQPSAKKSP